MAHSTKHRGSASHHGARTVVITMLSLVLIAALGVGLVVSPVFAMRSVTVEGERLLSEQEVLRAGGLGEETNVLLLSTSQTRTQMLSDPWIAEAEVTRSLPSSVSVTIRERRPVAVARNPGGFVVIADDGTSLALEDRDQGLPQIKGGAPASPGERSEQIVGAAAAAAAWDESVLRRRPVVTVAPDGTLTIELDGRVPVLWGDARDPEEKAQALAGVLAWADRHRADIESIDVRVPHAPAAELRERGSDATTEEDVPLDEETDASDGERESDERQRSATDNDNDDEP